MHELGIAQSILETVEREAGSRGARPRRVGVAIGPWAGVNPAALTFAWEALMRGTNHDGVELVVEQGQADELLVSYLELEEG